MTGRLLIQIEDGDPFEPDAWLGILGNRAGTSNASHDDDAVTCEVPTSSVALLQYRWRGRKYENWYRSCQIVAAENGDTIAIHRGLLCDNVSALVARAQEALLHARDGAEPAMLARGSLSGAEISLKTWPFRTWADIDGED